MTTTPQIKFSQEEDYLHPAGHTERRVRMEIEEEVVGHITRFDGAFGQTIWMPSITILNLTAEALPQYSSLADAREGVILNHGREIREEWQALQV